MGMVMNQKTRRVEPIESLSMIYREIPAMQSEVSLDFFSMASLSSADVTPALWVDITRKIDELYDRFDGFVIVHGTNTLHYTAAALSFSLQNLSKPIILTGATYPLNDMAGDGRMNLIFAIRAAQLDIAEVCIVLGPRVLRGCRAKKVDESFLQTFDTPRCPPLANFSAEVELNDIRTVRRKRTLVTRPEFNANVVVLTLTPGMPNAYLDAVVKAKPEGIVVCSYGVGMVADSLIPWLHGLTEQGIPIVFTSQTLKGSVDLHRYRRQLALEELGVISGKNMTYECAMVKLMWAMRQTKKPLRLREIMEKNLVGELDD